MNWLKKTWSWTKRQAKRLRTWVVAVVLGGTALALNFAGIPSGPLADGADVASKSYTPIPITADAPDHIRLGKIADIKDDSVLVKSGDGFENLYPTDQRLLPKDNQSISDSGVGKPQVFALENPEALPGAGVLTLYVRSKADGPGRELFAELLIGEKVVLTIHRAANLDIGWWTEWASAVGEWTKTDLDSASVRITTSGSGPPVSLSGIRLLIQQ